MAIALDLLRKGFMVLLLFAAGGYFLYAYAIPCKAPVHYRIGTLDERFEISEGELRAALLEAEAIWEDAAGEDLFEYRADARMPVNLLYDTRQAITQKNNDIREEIDRTSDTADTVKAAYDAVNGRYQTQKQSYLSAQASYDAQLKAYNESVAYWNARGGAPAREYQALQSQKASLERAGAALEEKRLALNALAEEVNALSGRYNDLAEEVNSGVDAINQTAGREFEEGLYTKSAWSSRIDIFEYSDRAELVRVLAHELGHALGLDHNQNKESIMYELNESENTKPTQEDLAELRGKCDLS